MQLVAVGAQDAYLTGNPEITFFKSQHRQHTPFAVESVAQTFNGQVGWNRRVSAAISRNGDLISSMWLEITMAYNQSKPDDVLNKGQCWYPAEAVLKEVELEIGGQRIDRHTSDFFRVYDELFRNEQQKKAYKQMTNFSDEDMEPGANGVTLQPVKRRFYVPLLWWFCRDASLSLPLIALQFHEVKCYFTFGDARAANVPDQVASQGVDDPNMLHTNTGLQATLYVDYIFLDAAERKNFASSNAELLITQLQYTTETIDAMREGTSISSTKNVRLSFNHPCSALIWFVKGERHGWYNVSRWGAASDATSADSFYNDMYAPIASAKLSINGHERSQARAGQYYSQVQTFQTLGARPQAGIYLYSFALDPSKVTQPNGTLNFSRVDNCTLSVDFKGMSTSTQTYPNAVSDPDLMVTDKHNINLKTLVVMALNWNVLRLVSGMAGLAFSN
jgi:hypothetical protein